MIIYDRQTRERMLELPDDLAGWDMREFGNQLHYGDFDGQDLTGCNFAGMDLEGAQFSNAKLARADFSNTNLAEAIFTRADLIGARFNGAKLNVTAFAYATLDDADLSALQIEGVANFRWIKAQRAKFCQITDLGGANFFQADLTDADFTGTDLSKLSAGQRLDTVLTGTRFAHLMEQS